MVVEIDGIQYVPVQAEVQLKPSEFCPKCGMQNAYVYDSRVLENGTRERKKKCGCCGARYRTREHMIAIVREYTHVKENYDRRTT